MLTVDDKQDALDCEQREERVKSKLSISFKWTLNKNVDFIVNVLRMTLLKWPQVMKSSKY